MAATGGPPPLDPNQILAIHRTVRADPSIQFDLPVRAAEVRQPPPDWLMALVRGFGRFVEWVGGGWQVLLWLVVAALFAGLVIGLFPGVRAWVIRLFRRTAPDIVEHWTPTDGTARALLADADALADGGRYDDAVRLLLFRSIDDIARWRGELVRPSLTSRDIAGADALPDSARGVFAGIVAAVERSLFAGRSLGVDDWRRARAEYAAFALTG